MQHYSVVEQLFMQFHTASDGSFCLRHPTPQRPRHWEKYQSLVPVSHQGTGGDALVVESSNY